MSMGQLINTLRIQKGLTLQELGSCVGVGASTVRKWETGFIENMKADKVEKLAKALGVSPGYLMGWTEESIPHEKEPSLSNDGEQELLRIYRSLSVRDRVKLLSFAIQLEDEKKG